LCDEHLLEDTCYRHDLYLPFQEDIMTTKKSDRSKILADIIAQSFGYSVLEIKEIRDQVLEKSGEPEIRNWQPGGSKEAEACFRIGLPINFSGVSDYVAKESFELV